MWFYLIDFWIHNAGWQTQTISNQLKNRQFLNNTSRGILPLVRCLLIMGWRWLSLRFKWSLVSILILFNLRHFSAEIFIFQPAGSNKTFYDHDNPVMMMGYYVSMISCCTIFYLCKRITLLDLIALQHNCLENFCACNYTKVTSTVLDYHANYISPLYVFILIYVSRRHFMWLYVFSILFMLCV